MSWLTDKLTDNKLTRAVARAIGMRRYAKLHHEAELAAKMRGKETIDTLFLLDSLSAWKTETLYLAMADHPRFAPRIALTPTLDAADNSRLRAYLDAKGYPYTETGERGDLGGADIAFYQKPYAFFTERRGTAYWRNPLTLGCYVDYAFHTTETPWNTNLPFLNDAWKNFFENDDCAAGAARLMDNGGRNSVVTGLPMQDELMRGAAGEADPWRACRPGMKRVIYAPHHSIADDGGLNYSTFLELGEEMLAAARRHKGDIQFAFKPHPLLRGKLERLWGKGRTDDYYAQWATMENSQVSEGRYTGLFFHSDAMVHDCSSFVVEYHFTRRPCLYLVKAGRHSEVDSSFAREAFGLHYHGTTAEDIEDFLSRVVIGGDDPMRGAREEFFAAKLTPPHGRTASENIISEILGEGE